MSWTAPRTFTVGEILTAANMNTYISADLSALSTHAHTGAAGDGGTSLGPLVLGDFTDATAPAAPGSGKTRLYAVSGQMYRRAGAAGASSLLLDDATTHAKAQHTDRSATQWFPAPLWSLDSGTRVTRGSTPNQYDAIQFANAATQGAYLTVQIEENVVATGYQLCPVFAGDGSAAGDISVRTGMIEVSQNNDLISNAVSTQDDTKTMFAAADTTCSIGAKSITANTVRDMVKLWVGRVGGAGADTYTGAAFFIGAYLLYTADE